MTVTFPLAELRDQWHPVAAATDLVPRHIFHARLLGMELALWRDSNGAANAWENRCPHRGLRLTSGRHCGTDIECRYHGLRFESQTGRCTRVPAHPGEPIPERIRMTAFPVMEAFGLVWTCFGEPRTPAPTIKPAPTGRTNTLRALPFAVSAAAAHEALRTLQIEGLRVLWLIQPASDQKCIVHGLLEGEFDAATVLCHQRECNRHLGELRARLESESAGSKNVPAGSKNPLWHIEPAA